VDINSQRFGVALLPYDSLTCPLSPSCQLTAHSQASEKDGVASPPSPAMTPCVQSDTIRSDPAILHLNGSIWCFLRLLLLRLLEWGKGLLARISVGSEEGQGRYVYGAEETSCGPGPKKIKRP
jgi:hypothetical protein